MDTLIIGKKSSYDDYEASVKERIDHFPKKKSIKESVPFSNKVYDFSKINGEIYWEERTLEYIFEITAKSAEELEDKKREFATWIMNVDNEKIYDPFIQDYHFVGTFAEIESDDSEFEKATITVKFTAYPYMIADYSDVMTVSLTEGEWVTMLVNNDSSHRINPTFISEVPFLLKADNASYGIPAGETMDKTFWLAVGENNFRLQSTEGNGTLRIEFYKEVF